MLHECPHGGYLVEVMWKKPSNIIFAVVMVVIAVLVGWTIASKFGVVAPPLKQSTLSRLSPTSDGNPKNKNAYLSKDDPTIGVDDLGPRKWKIVDIHEHAKGEEEAKMLLKYMDKFGIQRTALMGSTTYTLTLNPIYGFEGFKDNNESLLKVKAAHPDRFAVFVTFDPCDAEDKVALVKDYVSRGADGVKLYLGHGASTPKFAFHCEPIDSPNMEPFFAWAEEVQLPIVLHVNLEKYWDEMLHVLEKHPYLRVDMPHFGLQKSTEQRLKRLAFLFDRYPYTFTDISFGYYTFQLDGFEVLAKFRSRSREFLAAHKDRIMYASDMVLEPGKDEPYVENTLRSYMQFLEKERWRDFLVPKKTMHGMGLDDDVLHNIYEVAPKHFLLLDDQGRLPDRTKNPKVEVPRPAIPPLDPASIPPLKAPPKDPSKDSGGLNAPSGPAKGDAPKNGEAGDDDNNADDNNSESGGAPAKKGAGGEPERAPFAPEGDDEGESGDDDDGHGDTLD